jgi:hypothetical protein
MLVVVLEYHDANQGGKVTELGRVLIANDATGTPELGNYVVRAGGEPFSGFDAFRNEKVWRRPQQIAEVRGHARNLPAWQLVARALHALGFKGG